VKVKRHVLAALYPRERPGVRCTGTGWAPGPVWTGATRLTYVYIQGVPGGMCQTSG